MRLRCFRARSSPRALLVSRPKRRRVGDDGTGSGPAARHGQPGVTTAFGVNNYRSGRRADALTERTDVVREVSGPQVGDTAVVHVARQGSGERATTPGE